MREAVGARKTALLTLTEIPCWIPKARAALWTSIHSCNVLYEYDSYDTTQHPSPSVYLVDTIN